MKAGVHDYLLKGRLARLIPVVTRELADARERQARRAAEQALRDREQQAIVELAAAYEATLEGWARALDLRDRETEGHSRRVTELTVRLARLMGVTEADCVHIRRGALLHDIGKMGLPDDIPLKPSPLTTEEWDVMRRHPAHAHELLAPIDYRRPALDIPYSSAAIWSRACWSGQAGRYGRFDRRASQMSTAQPAARRACALPAATPRRSGLETGEVTTIHGRRTCADARSAGARNKSRR